MAASVVLLPRTNTYRVPFFADGIFCEFFARFREFLQIQNWVILKEINIFEDGIDVFLGDFLQFEDRKDRFRSKLNENELF